MSKIQDAGLVADVTEVARRARAVARLVARLPTAAKVAALHAVADRIESRVDAILSANQQDLASARSRVPEHLLDRLRLDAERVAGLARSVREIAAQPDPVGEISELVMRPNGLRVGRMRIPLGVVAMIYESRPNVTCDAAALCFTAGNAVILRGGSEAFHSNTAIADAVRAGLDSAGIPPDAVQLIRTIDRAAVSALLLQEAYIDLVIPRGGESLIRSVVEQSRIPVLQHYRGVCHVFVDESADTDMATEIVFNSKVQRPGVCNALETLLVHRSVAERALPQIAAPLVEAGVELRGCEHTRAILGAGVRVATEEDWAAEYLDLVLAIRVVEDLEHAADHIARYGSSHTDAIVTSDYARAQEFVATVDSSTVVVNASTRFADGGELGLGAEIGISTSKLHAFGPMGARQLTTTKWVIYGQGEVREPSGRADRAAPAAARVC